MNVNQLSLLSLVAVAVLSGCEAKTKKSFATPEAEKRAAEAAVKEQTEKIADERAKKETEPLRKAQEADSSARSATNDKVSTLEQRLDALEKMIEPIKAKAGAEQPQDAGKPTSDNKATADAPSPEPLLSPEALHAEGPAQVAQTPNAAVPSPISHICPDPFVHGGSPAGQLDGALNSISRQDPFGSVGEHPDILPPLAGSTGIADLRGDDQSHPFVDAGTGVMGPFAPGTFPAQPSSEPTAEPVMAPSNAEPQEPAPAAITIGAKKQDAPVQAPVEFSAFDYGPPIELAPQSEPTTKPAEKVSKPTAIKATPKTSSISKASPASLGKVATALGNSFSKVVTPIWIGMKAGAQKSKTKSPTALLSPAQTSKKEPAGFSAKDYGPPVELAPTPVESPTPKDATNGATLPKGCPIVNGRMLPSC